MARLYFRITGAGDSQKESVPPIYEGTTYHPYAQSPDPDRMDAFALRLGYQIVPSEAMPYDPREWPLTVVAYVKTERGSRCSQAYRLPCRKGV